MKLVITNTNTNVVPIMSNEDGGWADALEPDTPFTVDRPSSVIILGDKPDWFESFSEGLETIVALIRSLIDRWRHRDAVTDVTPHIVDVVITNDGANAVRVILGDNANDSELPPGITAQFSAPAYIELRELGVGAPAHEVNVEGG